MKKKIFLTALLTISISCFLISNVSAENFEEFLENDEAVNAIYRDRLSGQTFTAVSSHNVAGIKLWLKTPQTRTSLINVFLTGTKDGQITREWQELVLTKGTIYASSINPLNLFGNQYHIIFDDTSIYLATDTIYAIILEDAEATSMEWVGIRGGGNGYEFGSNWYKEEELDWVQNEEKDLYFKIIGELQEDCTSSEEMCTCTTTLTEISNTSTGAGFWLDSSISLGDFLIAGLLVGMFILLIVHFAFSLEVPKKVNFRRL